MLDQPVLRPIWQITRSRKRVARFSIFLLWLVIVNLWLYGRSSQFTHVAEDDLFEVSNEPRPEIATINAGEAPAVKLYTKQLGIEDRRNIKEIHSTNYDYIFHFHSMEGIFSSLTFQQRCDLYFGSLYNSDFDWYIDPWADLPLEHRYEFDFNGYQRVTFEEVRTALAQEKGMDRLKVSVLEVKDKIKANYDQFWIKIKQTEQKAADIISHVRIFNKCYIKSDNLDQAESSKNLVRSQNKLISSWASDGLIDKESTKFSPSKFSSFISKDSLSSCRDLETRIYRWLTFSYPIYERWTGEKHLSPPDMRKFVKSPEVFTPSNKKARSGRGKGGSNQFSSSESCFLQKFKNLLNGKGLVMTINDDYVNDAVKFIHLLRALGNVYPIQFILYDGISKESKDRLIKASRDSVTDLPPSFNKVSHQFGEKYFDPKNGGLVKQEIWFVNVRNVVRNEYRSKFESFSNKFLAILFNSFEEFLLVDADTVMMQNPNYFFDIPGYKEKGAYFYRDRTAPEFRPVSDGVFFKKMSPSILDQMMFGIPMITDHSLSCSFFDGMNHYMESGLVAINRNMHFDSILMMVQMNFLTPVLHRLYGDKELFWLAFTVNGDEDYVFNKYGAASLGIETPEDKRKQLGDPTNNSKEVCSAHPGHIDGYDGKTLAWFNSGFQFCGESEIVDYEKEAMFNLRFDGLKTPESLKAFYQSPLIIKHAIIPPFTGKYDTYRPNTEGGPARGWEMEPVYCRSYLWCAYSRIGGTTSDGKDTTQVGEFIEFDQFTQDLFKYYSDIWIGA